MGKVVNPDIANAVKTQMLIKGISCDLMAEKLGVTRQHIYNKISSGNFGYATAKKWAAILECPVSLLMEGKTDNDNLQAKLEKLSILVEDLGIKVKRLEKAIDALESKQR